VVRFIYGFKKTLAVTTTSASEMLPAEKIIHHAYQQLVAAACWNDEPYHPRLLTLTTDVAIPFEDNGIRTKEPYTIIYHQFHWFTASNNNWFVGEGHVSKKHQREYLSDILVIENKGRLNNLTQINIKII